MKTLEALGPVGVTLFFGNYPNRMSIFPATCADIHIPVNIASLTFYHFRKDQHGNALPGGSWMIAALMAFKTGSPMTLEIGSDDDAFLSFQAAGYAVGVVFAVVTLLSSAAAILTLRRFGLKLSLQVVVLVYEGFAGLIRAFFLIYHGPLYGYGPVFYNGMTQFPDWFLFSILTPLGLPTTILASLVWLKFTIFRTSPPIWFDFMSYAFALVVTVVSFYACFLQGIIMEESGVLNGLVSAATRAISLKLNINIVILSVSPTAGFVATINYLLHPPATGMPCFLACPPASSSAALGRDKEWPKQLR